MAAVQGKLTFDGKCIACHAVGKGIKVGPDLLGVTGRRGDGWLSGWLKSPEAMLKSDETAKAMLAQFKLPMPDQGLSEADIRRLLAYFHWFDRQAAPAKEAGH